MNKKNITLMVLAVVTLLTAVALATYAYFAGTVNVNNKANVTATTERNNMVFDTVGGTMLLNITAANMQKSQVGLAVQNSTTLTVNFQANTSYSMVCTYDIIYEWTSNSSNRYTTHSNGVTGNEFTIQASLASNAHVTEGTNSIKNEADLSTAVGNQASATVVSGAQIDGTGSTASTAVWTISSKFYNVNANQSGLANKSYQGRFKVANVSCVSGNVTSSFTIATPEFYWKGYNTSYNFPSHPDNVYSSGSNFCRVYGDDREYGVYVGQDSTKYYACATIQDHEVCLSQPYTQYGLEGHNAGSGFTTVQQTNAINALDAVFNAAGITDYSCSSDADSVSCSVSDMYCHVFRDGSVSLSLLDMGGGLCYVYASGDVHCDKFVG